jgi:N-acetylglucosaminyldiphosphoundecaprenol N-acetyl-beta-D-mannosaminyltransferase
MESQSAPDVLNIYRSAAMVTPDGMPLVWLLHRSGYRAAERICGPDLMPAIFRHSQLRGYRHFLYGSSETTLSLLQEKLSRNFPGARIVGRYSPPYRALTRQEEREVDRAVNAADPDIVWVGLGAPKQDRWMAAHRRALNAPVLIGVGAAFDLLAGRVTRAPRFLQRTGCEWMFRIAQEPRRLSRRYLESNSKFALMLIGEKLGLTKHQADA